MGRALYQCTRAAQRLVFIAPVQLLCTLQKGKPLTTFNSAALFLLIAQTCSFTMCLAKYNKELLVLCKAAIMF